MIFKFISSLLVFSFAFSASAADSVNDNDDEVKQFREFFEKYELLGSQYDTALADLYADTANIMAVRVLPDGTEQKMAMDGKKWKQLIVDSMGFAK
ncbi:MAG: hypothetical protein ABIP02_00665, partial [Arenimonas sp.]